jgi:hypothetical protein
LASPVSQSLGSPGRRTPRAARGHFKKHRLHATRVQARVIQSGTPLCPLCGQPMRRRTASQRVQDKKLGDSGSPASGLGSLLIEDGDAGFPGLFEVGAFDEAAQANEVFATSLTPKHTGLLHAPSDDGFASCLHHTAANEPALAAEVAVASAWLLVEEVVDLTPGGFPPRFVHGWVIRGVEQGFGGADHGQGVAVFDDAAPVGLPLFGLLCPCAPKRGGKVADVFAGVVEVEDLPSIREVEPGIFPDPGGTIAEIDDFLCGGVTAPESFLAQQDAGHPAVFQSSTVAGGIWITQGLPLLIGDRLGEDAAEFQFPGVGAAIGLFNFDALELLPAHGHAGAVAADIEHGDGAVGRIRGWQGGESLSQGGGDFAHQTAKAS